MCVSALDRCQLRAVELGRQAASRVEDAEDRAPGRDALIASAAATSTPRVGIGPQFATSFQAAASTFTPAGAEETMAKKIKIPRGSKAKKSSSASLRRILS